MIPLSEVRIGNWVKHVTHEHEWQITLADFHEEYMLGGVFFNMSGIEITKEWLLKFGFKEILTDSSLFYHGNIGVDIIDNEYLIHFREVSIINKLRTSRFII